MCHNTPQHGGFDGVRCFIVMLIAIYVFSILISHSWCQNNPRAPSSRPMARALPPSYLHALPHAFTRPPYAATPVSKHGGKQWKEKCISQAITTATTIDENTTGSDSVYSAHLYQLRITISSQTPAFMLCRSMLRSSLMVFRFFFFPCVLLLFPIFFVFLAFLTLLRVAKSCKLQSNIPFHLYI